MLDVQDSYFELGTNGEENNCCVSEPQSSRPAIELMVRV
jgi:hypothetical protein